MNKKRHLLVAIISMLAFAACVPRYKAINISSFQLKEQAALSGVSIICGDSLLFTHQNQYSFVPLRVENNSDNSFELNSTSISVFCNYEQVHLVEPQQYLKSIRKRYWGYTVLGALGALQGTSVSSAGVKPSTVPVVGVVAIGIAAFYVVKTIKYNKVQRINLSALDLNGKLVLPGEIKEGLLVIDKAACNQISIRIE